MTTEHTPTLERIRSAAEAEFLKYGFRSASLRAYCALGRDDDRRVLRVLQK